MNQPSLASSLGMGAVALCTALVIVAAATLPFLTPAWVAFEQGRAEAPAWTGFAEPDLRAVTNAILADLVLGPPAFDVALGGAPVLVEAERAHMRAVRAVFATFYALAVTALAVLVVAFWRARRGSRAGRGWTSGPAWRSVRTGAIGLAGVVIVAGILVVVAFDPVFEVFHRLFFSAGSYNFDPRTDRLVQLFPERFWSDTAIAVGAVILALALVTARIAGRRGRAP